MPGTTSSNIAESTGAKIHVSQRFRSQEKIREVDT